MKKSTKIILGILITVLLFIGLFLWFLSYSSIENISHELPFKDYLNKPFLVKQPSTLRQNSDNLNRFSNYYLNVSSEEAFENDKTILKKYKVGDTIIFTSAKKYFSNHVGDSYYLLGNEKLDSGEIIEFEYSGSFQYKPAIWETIEEFLERRKLKKDFP